MDVNRAYHLNSEPIAAPDQAAVKTSAAKTLAANTKTGKIPGFETLFEEKLNSLNFSKHAARRMDERGIEVDNQLLANLEHAVEEARKKGSRDVAVIGREGVFIVNVPNNVVVTTISQDDVKDKIFTNIDSAVIM